MTIITKGMGVIAKKLFKLIIDRHKLREQLKNGNTSLA